MRGRLLRKFGDRKRADSGALIDRIRAVKPLGFGARKRADSGALTDRIRDVKPFGFRGRD